MGSTTLTLAPEQGLRFITPLTAVAPPAIACIMGVSTSMNRRS